MQLGVRIRLDDARSGYSSLTRVTEFPSGVIERIENLEQLEVSAVLEAARDAWAFCSPDRSPLTKRPRG